jgi:predicted component of type VI protein secretion system
MKMIAIVAALTILSGCSTTVPVKAKFPELPERLQVKCPTLEKVKEEAKLSDIAKTLNVNYSTYYECAVKHDAILEWYQTQKRIFESVK